MSRAFEARLRRIEDRVRALEAERKRQAQGGAVGVLVRTSGTSGSGGMYGASYIHKQLIPSTEWVVQHDMGKRPSVTVLDSTGREWEGDVRHLDDRRLRITFSAAFAGEAHLN